MVTMSQQNHSYVHQKERHLWRSLLVLMLIWCISPLRAQDQEPLRIVATTTQALDLVTILTRGLPEGTVEITGLMGAGVDPHLYKPTESDINAMYQADLLIYSGLHLEGQFDEIFESLGERGVTIVRMTEPVETGGYVDFLPQTDPKIPPVHDPHYWFDPRNWQLSTQYLSEQLGKRDPAHADLYRENATAYVAQLDLLLAWAQEGMQSVPAEQRFLVTSHDAFQYFGGALGWEMISVQGISTVQEAGVGDIQSVVDFVVGHNIPVMFVESSVPPNTINAVREAVQSQGSQVTTGVRGLYSDAMGSAGTYGGTYIGMFAENIYTILQSYQKAGVPVNIPPYPADLQPQPPTELTTQP
jgi:manganese/zinc/iron transport system substrate-binding protein